MHVLTPEQMDFWKANGFVVVSSAVPPANVEATVQAICDFIGADLEDRDSWYFDQPPNQMEELNYSGMVEMYHHQSLWDNRQHPEIYGAFRDLLDRKDLWVTIDRVNFNPPVREDWDFKGFIHWDIDTSLRPLPHSLQGILCLNDTLPGQGGFQCVPGFPARFESWVEDQPPDRDPWRPDIDEGEVVQVETRAGDLLIWNSLLPHGTSPNKGDRPRMAQYITMFAAEEENSELRRRRIDCWRHRRPPEGRAFPGDRLNREFKNEPAVLTPLGRKLLGLDRWSPKSEK